LAKYAVVFEKTDQQLRRIYPGPARLRCDGQDSRRHRASHPRGNHLAHRRLSRTGRGGAWACDLGWARRGL